MTAVIVTPLDRLIAQPLADASPHPIVELSIRAEEAGRRRALLDSHRLLCALGHQAAAQALLDHAERVVA